MHEPSKPQTVESTSTQGRTGDVSVQDLVDKSTYRKEGESMSSKLKISPNTQPQATSTEAAEIPIGKVARDAEIRRRAYEIYLERGEQPGRELDDWRQAEHELEHEVLRRAQAG
jgi:hypothetical protein